MAQTAAPPDGPTPARSSRSMVATVHPLATQAALDALDRGGNAIDAAIAAGFMLGVVDGYNSGIGGGCFILIRTADGRLSAIDGREMAPAAAHRDMYLVDGEPDTRLSKTGAMAAGVPGALAAYAQAVARHGNLDLADVILPAARVAEQGFEVTPVYARRLASVADTIREFPATAAVLLQPDGTPWQAGQVLRQPDLANTCRCIANDGTDWFYDGEFARRTGQWMKDHGGVMTAADFANYHTVDRQPVMTRWRDFEIIGFPPPSSGGVHVAQILNMLENHELPLGTVEEQTRSVHLIAEAMKRAFADRAWWLGDPDFAEVPRGLLDKDYAAGLAGQIDLAEAVPVTSHGTPPRADADFFERHTTHVAAADAEGNWVAMTTTLNTTFGSKVIIPGTGVVLNNQMDDFSIAPGIPNAYGLVGTESNCVQPGKRPLSSMSPTIVLRDGQPVMTVGAAGGPLIITQVLLTLLRHLQFGMPLEEAVGAPRFHHQWSPDLLYLESGFDDRIRSGLESRGHRIRMNRTGGVTQAIVRDQQTGVFQGVHDPRTSGLAAGQTDRD